MPNPWKQVAGLVKSAMILAILFLTALTAMFYWRGMRYNDTADDLREIQSATCRRLYPNTTVPPNVKSRLKSEFARLSGISGAGQSMPEEPCALNTLRLIIANLPPAVRLRMDKMSIEPHSIRIEGQTRTHSDAEIIARALKEGGLAVTPPRTEQLVRGGVGFRLVGSLQGETEAQTVIGRGSD
jgi:hypothetical protein